MKKKCLIVIFAVLLIALFAMMFSYWNNRLVVRESKHPKTYTEYLQEMDEIVNMFGEDVDTEAMIAAPQGDYQNKTPSPIASYEDAIALAKKECTVEYNVIEYSYDPQLDMWHVSFYEEIRISNLLTIGGGQGVYIWGNGVTQDVIYTR